MDRNLSVAGLLSSSAQQGCDPLDPDGREGHGMPALWAEDRRLLDGWCRWGGHHVQQQLVGLDHGFGIGMEEA